MIVMSMVDGNPECSLVQLETKMEVKVPAVATGTPPIDRLLDEHVRTRKNAHTISRTSPIGCEKKQADFAQWLTKKGMDKFWLHICETNFSIWCLCSWGRLKATKP